MGDNFQSRFSARWGSWTRYLSPVFFTWFVVSACCAVLLMRYPIRHLAQGGPLPTDFNVYLTAWGRIRDGLSPYVAADSSPYKYSPGILALIQALPSSSAMAWVIYSTVSIFGFSAMLLAGAKHQTWRSFTCLVLGLGLAWKGILETLDYGQLELLIFTLALGAALLQRRIPILAGVLAGSLPWFKLPWVLLLLPLLLAPVPSLGGPGRKERRLRMIFTGYLLSCVAWGAAIPSLAFGAERAMQLTREWIGLLQHQPEALYFSDINQSVWISALRWMGGDGAIALGLAAVFAGLVFGRLSVRSLGSAHVRDALAWMTPWLLLTQLLNPLSWRWGSVFAAGAPFAVPVGGLKQSDPDHPRAAVIGRWICVGIVALLWLLQQNPFVKLLGFEHWSGLHPYGAITAYWVALLLLML